jgi:RNA polymerase sigma-70 factor (ECF subfamily)
VDNDKEIIELYRSGEREQAFNILLRTYRERLYWHIRKMVCDHDDADDLLQSTFVKAWEALPSFRGESGIFTWLYRIATNVTITFLKKKSLSATISLSDYSSKLEGKIEEDPYFNGDDIQMRLQKAIASLPPKQRNVFILRYFDEMKYSEISQITGITEGALKASYHHAYEKVRKYMAEHSDWH